MRMRRTWPRSPSLTLPRITRGDRSDADVPTSRASRDHRLGPRWPAAVIRHDLFRLSPRYRRLDRPTRSSLVHVADGSAHHIRPVTTKNDALLGLFGNDARPRDWHYLMYPFGVDHHAIVTQAATEDELREMVRDAVRCHFDEDEPDRPRVIRLHFVRDEVIAA